jgi:hypothetical protein
MIASLPKLRRLCVAVDKHDKIQSWIKKTYPANYPRGNY